MGYSVQRVHDSIKLIKKLKNNYRHDFEIIFRKQGGDTIEMDIELETNRWYYVGLVYKNRKLKIFLDSEVRSSNFLLFLTICL